MFWLSSTRCSISAGLDNSAISNSILTCLRQAPCLAKTTQSMLCNHVSTFFTILKAKVSAGARLAKVVSFLLQLGCQGVGNPISTAGFDELQQSIGADLARLGLLKPFKYAILSWFMRWGLLKISLVQESEIQMSRSLKKGSTMCAISCKPI